MVPACFGLGELYGRGRLRQGPPPRSLIGACRRKSAPSRDFGAVDSVSPANIFRRPQEVGEKPGRNRAVVPKRTDSVSGLLAWPEWGGGYRGFGFAVPAVVMAFTAAVIASLTGSSDNRE